VPSFPLEISKPTSCAVRTNRRVSRWNAPGRSLSDAKWPWQGSSSRVSTRDDWLDIPRLPEFDALARNKRLKLCSDHDVPSSVVHHLREVLGLNVITAQGERVSNHEDQAIAAWARRTSRVLLTFNHHDFFSDERTHPIHQCPGIIAISIPNNGYGVPDTLKMLEVLISGLARNVGSSFWPHTKIRVARDQFLMRKYRNGKLFEYVICVTPNGRLMFMELRHSQDLG